MLTDNQRTILRAARRYKWLNREITQDILGQSDAALTRQTLRSVSQNGWLRRVEIKPNLFNTANAPVYLPTDAGCALLATECEDMCLLLDRQPSIRNPQDFSHFLQVTKLLHEMDLGVERVPLVCLQRMLTEHCFINPEDAPEKRRLLCSIVGQGKKGGNVVCVPDFAHLLSVGGYVRVVFGELETGSDNPSRVSAKKTPGYSLFFKNMVWKQLFPCANDMRVIAVCPNASWRDSLKENLKCKDGAELWLCVARCDVRRDGRFLIDPVFHPVDGDPRPLVRTPPPSPQAVAPPGASGGAVSADANTEQVRT